MKEHLRINTFRTKSSEFYHVKNNKKKVSMNKAYILHSRFGLNIKEYKSGKHVKTYISSKRKNRFGGGEDRMDVDDPPPKRRRQGRTPSPPPAKKRSTSSPDPDGVAAVAAPRPPLPPPAAAAVTDVDVDMSAVTDAEEQILNTQSALQKISLSLNSNFINCANVLFNDDELEICTLLSFLYDQSYGVPTFDDPSNSFGNKRPSSSSVHNAPDKFNNKIRLIENKIRLIENKIKKIAEQPARNRQQARNQISINNLKEDRDKLTELITKLNQQNTQIAVDVSVFLLNVLRSENNEFGMKDMKGGYIKDLLLQELTRVANDTAAANDAAAAVRCIEAIGSNEWKSATWRFTKKYEPNKSNKLNSFQALYSSFQTGSAPAFLEILSIIEVTQIGLAITSKSRLGVNNICENDDNNQHRDSRGLCSNKKSQVDLEGTGITEIENEALLVPALDASGFGFYKRCYLCGLQWQIVGTEYEDKDYRKEAGAEINSQNIQEPKQAEHVIPVSRVFQMLLLLLNQKKNNEYIWTNDQIQKLTIDNIRSFTLLFGGVNSKYNFLYVDSCALCNQIKNDILPYKSDNGKSIKVNNNMKGIVEKIYSGDQRNDNYRNTWNQTLGINGIVDKTAKVSEQATKLKKRYDFILKFIDLKLEAYISEPTQNEFGKILIPVKRYGVQRVNISKLKKSFTDKEIRFIKKHII
jgi:hypothetical protein